jgi:hypothetical protein
MDAFEILVVVLSSIFALLLVGLTIATFIVVKILKDVKNITDKASTAADNIEHAAMMFKNTSGVASVVKIVGNAVEAFRSGKKGKD